MLFTTIMGLSADIFRNSLKAELQHLVKINFFTTFSISLLDTLLGEFSGVSKALFYAGLAVFGALCVFVFLCLVGTIKSVVKGTAFEA